MVALAPLKDQQKRDALALEAVEAGWTPRQVKAAAQKESKRKGKKPGPTAKPVLIRRFAELIHGLKKLSPTHRSIANLGQESHVELLGKVAALRQFVEGASRRFDRPMPIVHPHFRWVRQCARRANADERDDFACGRGQALAIAGSCARTRRCVRHAAA